MNRLASAVFEDEWQDGAGYAILDVVEGQINLLRFSVNFVNHIAEGTNDKMATRLLDQLTSNK